jgi:hypothetical protein
MRNMPRDLSGQEKFADILYVILQILSKILFIILGIIGFIYYKYIGAIGGAIIGYLIGHWIRYSLGRAGSNPHDAYFVRMRQRANGSKPRLLEYLLEKIRGNEFTQKKCREIIDAYDDAIEQLRKCSNEFQRQAVLNRLDTEIKSISYGKN